MQLKEYKLGEIAEIVPGYAFKASDFGFGENIAIKIKDISPFTVDISNSDRVNFVPQNKSSTIIRTHPHCSAIAKAIPSNVLLLNLDLSSLVFAFFKISRSYFDCLFFLPVFCQSTQQTHLSPQCLSVSIKVSL